MDSPDPGVTPSLRGASARDFLSRAYQTRRVHLIKLSLCARVSACDLTPLTLCLESWGRGRERGRSGDKGRRGMGTLSRWTTRSVPLAPWSRRRTDAGIAIDLYFSWAHVFDRSPWRPMSYSLLPIDSFAILTFLTFLDTWQERVQMSKMSKCAKTLLLAQKRSLAATSRHRSRSHLPRDRSPRRPRPAQADARGATDATSAIGAGRFIRDLLRECGTWIHSSVRKSAGQEGPLQGARKLARTDE